MTRLRAAISIFLLAAYMPTAWASGVTQNLTVTSTPTPIVAAANCYEVIFYENSTTPSHTYGLILGAVGYDTSQHASGEKFTFVAPRGGTFVKGQILGYAVISSGSATFVQVDQ